MVHDGIAEEGSAVGRSTSDRKRTFPTLDAKSYGLRRARKKRRTRALLMALPQHPGLDACMLAHPRFYRAAPYAEQGM